MGVFGQFNLHLVSGTLWCVLDTSLLAGTRVGSAALTEPELIQGSRSHLFEPIKQVKYTLGSNVALMNEPLGA